MMPPIRWPARALLQLFPKREVRDCCHYHSQDMHSVASAAIEAYKLAVSRHTSEDADEVARAYLEEAPLGKEERRTAQMLLTEGCEIQLWRTEDGRRWTYIEGRHRARALMDAGVRRVIVHQEDDRAT